MLAWKRCEMPRAKQRKIHITPVLPSIVVSAVVLMACKNFQCRMEPPLNAEDILIEFQSLIRMMNWTTMWHRVRSRKFDIEASNKLFAYHCP